MLFSEFIKAKRLASRLTLREFCRHLNMDPSNWSKIERGVTPPPMDGTFLQRTSQILHLTAAEEAELQDLASLARGQIPADLQEADILAKMPAFFRAIRGQEYSQADLQELLEGVKNLHQPGR